MATGFERRITSLENRLKAIKKHRPTPTENGNTPRVEEWRQLLLDAARDFPQCRDYIIPRLEAVEREYGFLAEPHEDENGDTLIDHLVAWTDEQRAIIARQLANVDHDYGSDEARREAKGLLGKILDTE